VPISHIEASHARLLAARTALAEGAADPARQVASACSDTRLAVPGRSQRRRA
jgi:hypothetical protein